MKYLLCNFLENHYFQEGTTATSIHPSGKNYQMTRIMEHIWNDTDRKKSKCLEQSCLSV